MLKEFRKRSMEIFPKYGVIKEEASEEGSI